MWFAAKKLKIRPLKIRPLDKKLPNQYY